MTHMTSVDEKEKILFTVNMPKYVIIQCIIRHLSRAPLSNSLFLAIVYESNFYAYLIALFITQTLCSRVSALYRFGKTGCRQQCDAIKKHNIEA